MTQDRTSSTPTHRGGGALRQGGVVLLLTVGVAAVAGVVWEWLWEPTPGAAYGGKWALAYEGLPRDFDGTGLYVVTALVAGLLVGLVATVRFRRDEVVTLLALIVGAVVGGIVMAQVGHLLGPPDPYAAAVGKPDYAPVPADLVLHGWSAYAAYPAAALTGAVGVLFGLPRDR